MSDVQPHSQDVDPETICTRVVSRVIEQLGRLDIAPDSPKWETLRGGQGNVGELRTYRGRRGVQHVVCAHLNPPAPPMDSHMAVVFTDPGSPVPHLVVDAVAFGERASFHVDLLPKVDLGVSPAYLAHCFAPLDGLVARMAEDGRLTPGTVPLGQQALLTPWSATYQVAPADLPVAMEYTQAYFDHWSSLLTGAWPAAATDEVDPQIAAGRSAKLRASLFSRAVDPVWGMLDRALSPAIVDRLLAVLIAG